MSTNKPKNERLVAKWNKNESANLRPSSKRDPLPGGWPRPSIPYAPTGWKSTCEWILICISAFSAVRVNCPNERMSPADGRKKQKVHAPSPSDNMVRCVDGIVKTNHPWLSPNAFAKCSIIFGRNCSFMTFHGSYVTRPINCCKFLRSSYLSYYVLGPVVVINSPIVGSQAKPAVVDCP